MSGLIDSCKTKKGLGKFVKEFGIFVALKLKFKSLRLRVVLSVNI